MTDANIDRNVGGSGGEPVLRNHARGRQQRVAYWRWKPWLTGIGWSQPTEEYVFQLCTPEPRLSGRQSQDSKKGYSHGAVFGTGRIGG